MAFESLTEKLQNVFKNLRSKGRLTEADVKTALKEVKMALLEADVSFKVVKQFIKSVQEQAVGQDVMNGLNPGQMVIKIVNDELVKLMGSETTEIALRPASEVTIIMMAGLQGAGKTTTTAKIAGKLKAKGRKPLLAACDVYRPAAIKQLQVNGEKQGVEVFAMGDKNRPVDIAKAALVHAKTNGFNVLILDTAGRLHIDEEMMQELQDIKAAVPVDQTLLVVDAMTGQDAVNVAEMFSNKVGIDGVVLTKLDGDTRGGAALSIRAVSGKPILYVGMGEKLSDLEQFYPDRMASRILGMGDVMSLIEKAQANIDEEKAKAMEQKMKKAQFDFNDYLDSMEQMRNMGGISSILIPKHFCHVDVRTANEDQNPGAFNAFSAAGPRVGLFCVLCDIGKGFLPVFLAVHSSAVSMGSWLFALILLAPVAGHAWPFLQPAKGGKAISVSFGVLLGLLPDLRPALLLAAFYLTFSLILIIQPHNLRSIASFAGFAAAAQLSRFLPSVRLGSLLVSLVVCYRHFFSFRRYESENVSFTIQSLSAKIRDRQKKH